MTRFACLPLALLASLAGSAPAADPPSISKSYLGDLTGKVTKISADSLTLSVPEAVADGVTRKKVGGRRGRTVMVPKVTTKLVDETIPLATTTTVKTVTGKAMTLADVKVGDTIRVHVYAITLRETGQKPETHPEVQRIEMPNPPPTPKAGTTPPAPAVPPAPPKKK